VLCEARHLALLRHPELALATNREHRLVGDQPRRLPRRQRPQHRRPLLEAAAGLQPRQQPAVPCRRKFRRRCLWVVPHRMAAAEAGQPGLVRDLFLKQLKQCLTPRRHRQSL
jgi:hypothetical protein